MRIVISIAAVALLTVLATMHASADTITAIDPNLSGTVTHVRDGDTIEVSGVPVRLNGVSAPEGRERYGAEATAFMRELVAGKDVRCILNGERSYDRVIGRCFLDGQDIGAAIIETGWARDCPRYSGGRYAAEDRAGQARGFMPGYTLPGYCRP
jgi:micrococcal nuclease